MDIGPQLLYLCKNKPGSGFLNRSMITKWVDDIMIVDHM